jgi:hypothetical protein
MSDYRRCYLMSDHSGKCDHWVSTAESVEVRATHPNHLNLEKHIAGRGINQINVNNNRRTWAVQPYSLHPTSFWATLRKKHRMPILKGLARRSFIAKVNVSRKTVESERRTLERILPR